MGECGEIERILNGTYTCPKTNNNLTPRARNHNILQGLSHVCNIVEYLWKNSITGHFITSSLEHLRIELGMNIQILQSNYNDYKDILLTESWIRSTWKFMSEQSITIPIEIEEISTQCEYDVEIMATVSRCKN